jgi:hypothetical protein
MDLILGLEGVADVGGISGSLVGLSVVTLIGLGDVGLGALVVILVRGVKGVRRDLVELERTGDGIVVVVLRLLTL